MKKKKYKFDQYICSGGKCDFRKKPENQLCEGHKEQQRIILEILETWKYMYENGLRPDYDKIPWQKHHAGTISGTDAVDSKGTKR